MPLRLRAPKEHGQILAVPPLTQVATLLAENQRILNSVQPLAEMRALARREILAASTQYHQEAGQPISSEASGPWMVAGHQPELFHPGVWFKSFALHPLARDHGATALNLVIDIDTPRSALLHVPADRHVARVSFDRSSLDLPYEERTVEDEATFADFPERLKPIIANWNFEPMLEAFWHEVLRHAKRTPLLGERFASARRSVERRWGCEQREVPMSRVCQTEAFARFACSILERLPAFHSNYNSTVHEYRAEHGIKSRSHPVPDLAADGAWLEAPFWAWRRGDQRRGKLFIQTTRDAWHLRVGGTLWPTIPRAKMDDAVAAWRALEQHGFKVRSRALTTTMFARLFLADLFIHGIGGGIYDELTDRILERYFGIPIPAFLILSATLLLPLPRFPDAVSRLRDLGRRWRDLVYKPERFAEANGQTETLIAAKREWIARGGATHAERVERYYRIRELNARLLPFLIEEKMRVEREYAEVRRQKELHEVAARRDYAFCLYPEDMLRSFFAST